MPNREMRGRYLMREFWSDVEIQVDLNAEERWFLVGLWMLADDGGYLVWDPRFIGGQLYAHEERAEREKKVAQHLEKLETMKKARRFACGHVFLPSAARYPRPGRRSDDTFAVQREHESEPKRTIRQHSGKKRNHSGMNANHSGMISLPDPTLPNLTQPLPQPNGSSNQQRARARGGAPQSLKDIVGWDPAAAPDPPKRGRG